MVHNQDGNVLFLILIAVVLFAALSYAVTSSTRNGGNISDETIEIELSEILNHFTAVQVAVNRLMLNGKCTEFDVRFWNNSRTNTSSAHYGDNSNTACEIYHPSGGGVPYQVPPESVINAGGTEYMVLSNTVYGVGTDNGGNDSAGNGNSYDLLIATNVPLRMCLLLNEREGITNTGGAPPAYQATNWSSFISPGTAFYTFPRSLTIPYVAGGPTMGSSATTGEEIFGHSLGCIQFTDGSGDPYYFMYDTLIAR